MTTQEYKDEIQKLVDRNVYLNNRIAVFSASAQDWRDHDNEVMFTQQMGVVNAAKAERATNLEQIAILQDEMRAMAEVAVNLSQQGKTLDAVQTVAEAEADAVNKMADQNVIAQAEKDAQAKKLRNIGILVAVVIAIAVSLVIYRKFIKR